MGHHIIAALTDFAKRNSLTESLVRHNPIFYRRVKGSIRNLRDRGESADGVANWYLDRTLSWAQETEYGKSFGRALAEWPILSKIELVRNPKRFKRRAFFAIPSSTGGSSGQPLRIWRSPECLAAQRAIVDSLLGDECKPMIKRRVAVLRADFVKDPADTRPPFGLWKRGGNWLVLSNAHLNRDTIAWFVDALTTLRPEILWVYPSALSNLLRLAGEVNGGLAADIVLSSSEMLSESLFKYAGQSLGARVIDLYGHGERACGAYAFSPREYWFDRAYGHVELIPTSSESLGDSSVTARIIATGYWNSAYPLVRYDTGDLAMLPPGSTSGDLARIARGESPFLGIIGRANDYIVGRAGERFAGLNHIPWGLDSVLQVQIIQDSATTVRLLAIPKEDLTSTDRQTMLDNARRILPPDINIEIHTVQSLEFLPNGKAPFVIRKSELANR